MSDSPYLPILEFAKVLSFGLAGARRFLMRAGVLEKVGHRYYVVADAVRVQLPDLWLRYIRAKDGDDSMSDLPVYVSLGKVSKSLGRSSPVARAWLEHKGIAVTVGKRTVTTPELLCVALPDLAAKLIRFRDDE